MKIKVMFRILFLVLVTSPAFVLAQEKKDPFTRETAIEQDADPEKGERVIVIEAQLARVPSTNVREWDEQGLSPEELRKRVQALVEEGKAEIADSVAGTWRSGSRGRFQSVLELRHPTAFEIISDSFDDPPYPMQFEQRNLGIYLEADPVFGESQNELILNFGFEWARHLGETEGAREVTERMQADDILEPRFSTQRVTRQARIPIGEYEVLTRIKPFDPEKSAGFDVIVFGRADVVVVNPVADKDLVAGVKQLKFRASWVEVDADEWHRAVYENSLSTWFSGKAWDRVREWEKTGKAKVLASPAIGSPSGQRAKVEVAETLHFKSSFPSPGSPEGSNNSLMDTRTIGHVLEFDPVFDPSGIVYFNVSAKSTSMHGYGVSYRTQEGGRWVPAVQFPKFYASSVATQVMLGKDVDLLVGVGTQPLESGQPDTSRKWLLFIHNDSYNKE